VDHRQQRARVRDDRTMLHVEIASPSGTTRALMDVLAADPYVTAVSLSAGVLQRPEGDAISFDVPRESAQSVLDRIFATGVHQTGTVRVHPVPTWVSRPAFDAMVAAPGAGADAMVWPEVAQRAYTDSELTWTYLAFMVMATCLAGIAIPLDSQILVIGAMVLGPEFGAIAALGVALVRRRRSLLRQAVRTLVVGFAVGIGATTLAALLVHGLGWVDLSDLSRERPGTAFIYSPDQWSFIVALIAGVAGVLSLTSAKTGGLAGVFISVTTIPAAANVALAFALGDWLEMRGSATQLLLNITGMALAGWATLALQDTLVGRTGRASGTIRRRAMDDPRRA
jgi:uncharacterized hydrophobic protein (TIGR00271 family)